MPRCPLINDGHPMITIAHLEPMTQVSYKAQNIFTSIKQAALLSELIWLSPDCLRKTGVLTVIRK